VAVVARVAVVIMVASFAANVLLGVFQGAGPRSSAEPPRPSARLIPASPVPSPREVVMDPALALSGRVGDLAWQRMLHLRDVRAGLERSGLALEAVAEMEPSSREESRRAWALGVDAERTALVLPGGEWLLVRSVSGVALVRGGDVISQSPPWVPGAPRRLRLEFPAPPAGADRVRVVVAWLTRTYDFGGRWISSGERVAELRLR
jgi:hypothetical protein